MIISRTPFRISFFGGGTDYPAWYRHHGGAVLAAAIDKYCYITCRHLPPFFENRFRVVYSRIELCAHPNEIEHPAVREVLHHLGVERGMDIHHNGDLPARSGMGTSSAFTVGLLNAVRGLMGAMPSRHELANESIHIEQELMHETVGSQDQVMAAYGGLNHVTFQTDGHVNVRPVTIPPERIQLLSDHLMLFFTGIHRTAADIAPSYVNDMEARSRQLNALHGMVDQGLSILCSSGDLDPFGKLLHEGWLAKRSLSDMVSTTRIDALYEEARRLGALGGKITGAGGGGFLLLFAPPERQQAIREKFTDLIHVPFNFDFTGSQVIYYHPEPEYAAEEAYRLTHAVTAFQESIRAAA